MKKIAALVLLGLLVVVNNVQAGTNVVKVAWDPPLTYEDGTPIGTNELTGYNVYGHIAGSPYALMVTTTNTTGVVANLDSGMYFFQVSALAKYWYAGTNQVVTDVVESARSYEIKVKVPKVNPNTPIYFKLYGIN
jgi:hypothetical protein